MPNLLSHTNNLGCTTEWQISGSKGNPAVGLVQRRFAADALSTAARRFPAVGFGVRVARSTIAGIGVV